MYLMTLSTHFIYGYMASDIWGKDHLDCEREETYRQDSTYHKFWNTGWNAKYLNMSTMKDRFSYSATEASLSLSETAFCMEYIKSPT